MRTVIELATFLSTCVCNNFKRLTLTDLIVRNHIVTTTPLGGNEKGHATRRLARCSTWLSSCLHISEEGFNVKPAQETAGYYIQGSDGPLCHVAEFLIDDEVWTIRYLALDTRNWWPGKRVLVAPSRIETIDRHNRTLHLGLSRDSIEHSPEYKVSMSQEEPHEMTTGCSL